MIKEKMKRTKLPKVGDVLRMEAFVDENVLAHYVHLSEERGPYVIVYRGGAKSDEIVSSLEGYESLFGPIGCGINPPVRSGAWIVTGHVSPPSNYRLPHFLAGSGGRPPFDPPLWFLIDSEGGEHRLGYDVPEEMQSLERNATLSAELIEDRIRSGKDLYGYLATMSHYK